jgi:hypothetical protein
MISIDITCSRHTGGLTVWLLRIQITFSVTYNGCVTTYHFIRFIPIYCFKIYEQLKYLSWISNPVVTHFTYIRSSCSQQLECCLIYRKLWLYFYLWQFPQITCWARLSTTVLEDTMQSTLYMSWHMNLIDDDYNFIYKSGVWVKAFQFRQLRWHTLLPRTGGTVRIV